MTVTTDPYTTGNGEMAHVFDTFHGRSSVVSEEFPVAGAILDSLSKEFGTTDKNGIFVVRDLSHADDLLKLYETYKLLRQPNNTYPIGFERIGRLSETRWLGEVSVSSMLENGVVTGEELALVEGIIPKLYVTAVEGASVRCPDPRILKDFNGFLPEHVRRQLGPQVIGGTAGAAISMRLGRGAQNYDGGLTLVDDVRGLSEIERKSGFAPGDHIHVDAREGQMGCKAVDDSTGILEYIGSPQKEIFFALNGLTRAILGESTFQPRIMSTIRGNAVELSANADRYLTAQPQVVEQLKQDHPDSLEVLAGPNNACFVVINFVPDTTLHKDLLNFLTGNRIQVINYDFWRSKKVAESLATDSSGQVDEEARRHFMHARVAYTVATLLRMLDGSQTAFMRVPNDFNIARSL